MHLALYRKWRSVNFDDVSGQNHVTSVLKYEVASGLISHAYLFSGPRGTGKTSCAKILSRAVNCEAPKDGNPCNECPSCRSILSGASVDVIEMDAASNNGVDNIRDIRDEVMFTPAESKYRVYIVDEVHMLSTSAFNALLKTLEEPPSHVIFILATTELHKLPETVISRCQRFDFRRLSVPVISDRLEYIAKAEGFAYTKGALDEIARISEGGMRDAISTLELCASRHSEINERLVSDVLGTLGYEKVAEAAKAIANADYGAVFSVISELTAAGRDLSVFWDELTAFYRDMLVIKTVKNPAGFLDLSQSSLGMLADAAKLFTLPELLYHSRLLDETSLLLSRPSGAKRISAELALIRMCDKSLDTSKDALLARISALEDTVKLLSVGGAVSISAPSSPEKRAKPKTSTPTVEEAATEAFVADTDSAAAPQSAPESRALPYWGELISKIAEKKPLIDGFRQFISGKAEDGKFVISCANPFTHKMCSDNIKLFAELISLFEGKLVAEKDISVRNGAVKPAESGDPLDDLI